MAINNYRYPPASDALVLPDQGDEYDGEVVAIIQYRHGGHEVEFCTGPFKGEKRFFTFKRLFGRKVIGNNPKETD